MTDNSKIIADLHTFANRLGATWGQGVLFRAADALDAADARIAELHDANVKLAQQVEQQRRVIRNVIVDRKATPRSTIESEPEVIEPALAIDGKPVCVCPGDDPRWRESVGHESYCPRSEK